MKRFFANVIFVAIIVLFFGFVGRIESIYTTDAKVVKINRTEDFISFEAEDGNIFDIYYEKGFTEGQRVKLVIDDNLTIEDKEDDIILKVKR